MADRYENIRKALAAYDTYAANGQEVTGRILLFSAMEEACDPDTIRELLAERDALENRVAQMLDALRSAEALAFCCMAEDCYSRREIRDMAEASAPRYTAAIAAENGGGNE